jgi:glyoxylase-like metal-dependent hydrolase (beta-lactamase superfamily II)
MTARLQSFGDGIFAIDSGYIRPQFDAIHLVVEQGRVAIIDTATKHAAPLVLQALETLGLGPESVDYVVLSHVHLDHAGGAGRLMELCPNAQLTVHPRGAPHMVNPERLWAAVVEVYGLEMAQREYGEPRPIDPSRIIETSEGTQIRLANRVLEFWDAPGHARHHVFVQDHKTKGVFTGDTYGISYRALDTDLGPFAFVSASPSQFDPPAHQASIRRVMHSDAPAVYLTHYAQVTAVQAVGEALLRQVDVYAAIAQRNGYRGPERSSAIYQELRAHLFNAARAHGVACPDDMLEDLIGLDLRLNADGLVCWLDRL